MHIWFRMYAQQMGMQNVRGILPEQIDLCINTSISDITSELVRDSISFKKDKEATNPKLYQINNLRNLYKVEEKSLSTKGASGSEDKITYDSSVNKVTVPLDSTIFYVLDFSIRYEFYKNTDTHHSNVIATKYFPVRLVDDRSLSDTLNDAILAPRIEAPVGVLYNGNTLDIYFGNNPSNANGRLNRTEVAAQYLRISYIETPAKVNIADSTDCNLIEALHVPVLKHAVSLYNGGLKDSFLGAQPQQQVQPQQSDN